MRVLFIGDVFAKPGRRAVALLLPRLRQELMLDLVVVNGENSAGGAGITAATARELFVAGADLITTGNHVWHQREALAYLPTTNRVLRPLNYPPGTPGVGASVYPVGEAGTPVLLLNVLGRIFMTPLDDPFRALDEALALHDGAARIIIVDIHAEATSEKRALGFYLDGRASLIVGTHTHVPTADAQVLPLGSAYVTDVGMVGPLHSVIGTEVGSIIARFRTALPRRSEPSSAPTVQFNSVLAEIDDDTGRAHSITRVDHIVTLSGTP